MARRASSSQPSASSRRARRRTRSTSAVAAATVLAILIAGIAVVATPKAAAARSSPPPAYAPPVDAPLADAFRPPPDRFSAGNRGIDYATAPGTPVRASARGVVTFAGPVGGSLHVVVLHPHGVRTSYSFLATTAVRRGQRVERGDVVGSTGDSPLHFGARVGAEYVDPLSLLTSASTGTRARLLPDDGRGLPSEAGERRALERLVRAVGRVARASKHAVAWVGRRAVPVADWLGHTYPTGLARDLAMALEDAELADVAATFLLSSDLSGPLAVGALLAHRRAQRVPCTSRSAPTPQAPARASGRRIAVLVGGLGSSSQKAAIDKLKVRDLGYGAGDVVRFSYRGGTTATTPYSAVDTQQDPAESGRRLRALIEDLARRHPGVPIDVFAHSLGGLVARSALAEGTQAPVGRLVTFGTPHDGADAAGVPDAIGTSPYGRALVALAAATRPIGIDPTRPVVGALAPRSEFITDLDRRGLPPGVQVTSVAARRDVVVPAPRSWLRGANNVVVPGHGVNAHDALPGSPEAYREAALAVAGRPPTCEGTADAVVDTAAAVAHQLAEAAAVLSLRGGGVR